MKVDLNWLQDYVDIDRPLEEICNLLTEAGLECRIVESGPRVPEGVIVGEVISVENHPNADKLSVCFVNTGEKEPAQIVCGAPNVAAGQKVPVAMVGTSLTPDFTLKKAKIRGVTSNGMICAEDELGLSEDHSGIMVLDESCEIGKPLNNYLPKTVILDIDLTANRPDCMSHIGVAREVAALTGKSLKIPDITHQETGPDIHSLAQVVVLASDGCPRYTARVIRNVNIGPSPDWLKKRIEAIGLRPVNNVVDASNYVLHETGHPLHTFDYDKLAEHRIIVRYAEEGETFETLDHKERTLSRNVLLICDGKKPVAMAGVMGGLDSEISDNTVNVLIESAYFDPPTIRKGSKQQLLSTDSSKRFERGTDPNANCVYAQDRLASLILELAGGNCAKGMIDVYPKKIEPLPITMRFDRLKKITSLDISPETCRTIFESLDISVQSMDDQTINVLAPTFRPDLEREIDLIEEIVRIYGLNKIQANSRLQFSMSETVDPLNPFLNRIREIFVGFGFHEAISNSLVSQDMANAGIWGYAPVPLMNPLSIDMNYLRTDLIQPLLHNLKLNAARKRQHVRLFEIGRVMEKDPLSETTVREHQNLGVIMCSDMWDLHWLRSPAPADFFFGKGMLMRFLDNMGITDISLNNTDFHPDPYRIFMDITSGKIQIGKIGEYQPEFLNKYQLEYPVVILELKLDVIFELRKEVFKYKPVSPFPSMTRDISIVVDKNMESETLMKEIHQKGSKFLKDVVVYDQFMDDRKLTPGKKALSYRLWFQSDERTLEDQDVDRIMEKIFNILIRKYGAQLR
ncbi:MAG: Phenylalanyl-tRNA synthetase subunit beta [Marinimicrobia bacterium 46_43]|nr:MAG: Phenylalanyl-tRNA synthetase subunit beta [Marinimicrobia bacterium 46_43]